MYTFSLCLIFVCTFVIVKKKCRGKVLRLSCLMKMCLEPLSSGCIGHAILVLSKQYLPNMLVIRLISSCTLKEELTLGKSHTLQPSNTKGYSTILLLSSPYILEVGMSEGMLGTESLVWVVGTQLHDKVGAPLGSMLHQRTDAQTILVGKVEVHVP